MKARQPRKVFRIGLTGGVASGKSTLARHLTVAGIQVIDLDEIGRGITKNNQQLLKAVAAAAGQECVAGDDVNRAALRRKVFADPAVRTRLEAVLHPAIWNEYNTREARAEARGKRVIVCEAALFVDRGTDKMFDELIVVHSSEDTRRLRLVARPGMDSGLAEQILSSQVSEADRLRAATVVIQNDGSEAELAAEAKKLIEKYKAMNLL